MRDALALAYPDGRRSWAPLAFTTGLHLLLVLAWLAGPGRLAVPVQAGPPASRLVFVAPLRLPDAALLAAPPKPRPRVPRASAASLPRPLPVPSPDSIARADGAADGMADGAADGMADGAADGMADGAADGAADGMADPDAEAPTTAHANAAPADDGTPPAAAAALPGELLATSKRMAGRVDRELRKGASPITAEPDRKWERFAAAIAGAHVAAGKAVTLASYTAPDGVIIYRKTVGKRMFCYRSGSVGGIHGGFGPSDGHGAGNVSCPSGVSWRRQ